MKLFVTARGEELRNVSVNFLVISSNDILVTGENWYFRGVSGYYGLDTEMECRNTGLYHVDVSYPDSCSESYLFDMSLLSAIHLKCRGEARKLKRYGENFRHVRY